MPTEGFDTHLGARCWEFESPYSDQNPSKSYDFDGFFFIMGPILDEYWRVSGGLIVSLKAKNEQGVFRPCPYCRYLIFSSAIYAILLFINPPNAKIHQINAAAMISFITIPTLVLD